MAGRGKANQNLDKIKKEMLLKKQKAENRAAEVLDEGENSQNAASQVDADKVEGNKAGAGREKAKVDSKIEKAGNNGAIIGSKEASKLERKKESAKVSKERKNEAEIAGNSEAVKKIEARRKIKFKFRKKRTEEKRKEDSFLNTELKVVAFKIAGVEYGIEINHVQEVNRIEHDLISLPGAPAFVVGLVNLRGDCIPVIDLQKRFGSKLESKVLPKLIVINHKEEKLGIMIESARVQALNEDCLEEIREEFITDNAINYFSNIAKLEGGKKLILILNLATLLSFMAE